MFEHSQAYYKMLGTRADWSERLEVAKLCVSPDRKEQSLMKLEYTSLLSLLAKDREFRENFRDMSSTLSWAMIRLSRPEPKKSVLPFHVNAKLILALDRLGSQRDVFLPTEHLELREKLAPLALFWGEKAIYSGFLDWARTLFAISGGIPTQFEDALASSSSQFRNLESIQTLDDLLLLLRESDYTWFDPDMDCVSTIPDPEQVVLLERSQPQKVRITFQDVVEFVEKLPPEMQFSVAMYLFKAGAYPFAGFVYQIIKFS